MTNFIKRRLQVFVSSTYTDLIEERQAAVSAILDAGHIPAGMELFTSGDESQMEVIKQWIDESDVYLLILGGRYGSVDKKTDKSYTQLEYEYIIEKNKPHFFCVLSEAAINRKAQNANDVKDIMEFENPQKLKDFRNLVTHNKVIGFGFCQSNQDIQLNIIRSLNAFDRRDDLIGWVRPHQEVNLPALSDEITRLSKENGKLRETIADLESKISPKCPKFELSISPIFIDNKYNSCKKLVLPEKISIDDVEEQLKEYITEEKIQAYNNKIPSQSEIDEYNNQLEIFYKIKIYSTPLVIKVCNVGTVKANNVYIDITFPNSLLIFTKDTEIEQPKSPIPYNPIRAAQTEYEKKLQESKNHGLPFSMFSKLNEVNALNAKTNMTPFTYMKSIRPINQTWWTDLKENYLTIKIESLLHTRCREFDDEYLIVPLKSGRHEIQVEIICEELESKDIQIIELDIQAS